MVDLEKILCAKAPRLARFLSRPENRTPQVAVPDEALPPWTVEEISGPKGLFCENLSQVREALICFGTQQIVLSPFLEAKLWRDTYHASKHLYPSTFSLNEVSEFVEKEILVPYRSGQNPYLCFFAYPVATAFTDCKIWLSCLSQGYHLHIELEGDDHDEADQAVAESLQLKRVIATFQIIR